MLAHGQAGLRVVEGRCLIGQCARGRGRVVEHYVFVGWTGDLGTVAVLRHGHGNRQVVVGRGRGDVPAVPGEAVALIHEKGVAGMRRGGRVVAAA